MPGRPVLCTLVAMFSLPVAGLPIAGLLATAGCRHAPLSMKIIDYQDPLRPAHYEEVFTEGYYTIDGDGDIDIILRRSSDFDPDADAPITQVIHIKSFWRSRPGMTVAHRTQINATVHYYVVLGRTGNAFEGAGSLFFHENRRGDVIKGSLELATLHPSTDPQAGGTLFGHTELGGRFRAVRDARKVRRIENDMKQLFD